MIGDRAPAIERIREKCLSVGKTLQPLAVVIGEEEQHLESQVLIDGYYYNVSDPKRAIEVCFQSFQSLHALYPCQSEAVWLVFQQYVYGINTTWDNVTPEVSTILNDLRNKEIELNLA